jgi:hypothetical protein
LVIKWSVQILLGHSKAIRPQALGHDMTARHLTLGSGMTIIP